jgi:hypothetical protein
MVSMRATIDTTLASQLLALARNIQSANQEGDTDGLMARLFLERFDARIIWKVSCNNEKWTSQHAQEIRQANFGKLAALGYSISFSLPNTQENYTSLFVEGMKRLQQRDLFPIDQVSFQNIPSAFLGIVTGTLSLDDGTEKTNLVSWMKQTLAETLKRNKPQGYQKLVYEYLNTLLDSKSVMIALPDDHATLGELALADWGCRIGSFRIIEMEQNSQILRERILALACLVDVNEFSAGESSVIWESVTSCLSSSIHDRVLSPSHVIWLLSRFESAMRRWRWDVNKNEKPIRWAISEEREVQDIVWLILRSVFEDLVDEDYLPKLGHSSYKPDFGIPSIGTMIEVKFARKSEDFKKIEKEIMEDAIAYIQATRLYKEIVIFIYDNSSSVQEHALTRSALEKLPNVVGVIIVSRPSQLPEVIR